MHTLQQLQSGQLKGSKSLKLSCGLTEVPSEILGIADSLEILDLSGNRLSSLPDWFAALGNLRITFFSNNDFQEFPAVLGKCPKLEMIGFKACKITTVPEDSIPLTTRWLILTDNQIEKLPTSIGNCARMQKLMLAGNKLQELPAEMANCQNLELLRISANELTQLPHWLFNLPRLSWLAFSGNSISSQKQTEVELPTINWTDLTVEQQLGEGASGVISKARWQTDNENSKSVAVKIFKGTVTSDGLPQDEMQACLLAGHHPNLVQALAKITGHPAHKQGLVLDLIPAGYRNLGGPPSFETCTRDTFPTDTVFSTKEILTIGQGIASVLAHLHSRGILHGDVYAHNTLINDSGHPLLSDFGAATQYDPQDTALASALQRLEVRAFGCLLEDLLAFVSPDNRAATHIKELGHLSQECQQPIVHQRPDFTSILGHLHKIAHL